MPKADDYRPLAQADRDELRRLRRDMEASSLGDRSYSMSAMKLQRLIELEAAEIRDYAHVSLQPERRYSLTEIQEMMRQWLGESSDIHGTGELALAFRLSMFIEWLKKREREVGDGQ